MARKRDFDPEQGQSFYQRRRKRLLMPPKAHKAPTPPPPPSASLTPLSRSMHYDFSWAYGDMFVSDDKPPQLSYDVVEDEHGVRHPVMLRDVEPAADVVDGIGERYDANPGNGVTAGHEQWHGFGRGKLEGVQPTYYALRCFSVDGTSVRGVIFSQKVYPGVNVAQCMSSYRCYYAPESASVHDAPDASCGCGFYGYLEGHDDWKGLGEYAGIEPVTVRAIVALSGRRLVGTKGLRAERMQVVAFAGPVTGYLSGMSASYQLKLQRNMRSIAASFGVPYFDRLDDALREYPLTKLSDEQQRWRYQSHD